MLAKEGRWQEIVAEKRAALQQIKHTLDTYHRLLTQAPVPADGVLKLLQSIVRCAQPGAGSLIGGSFERLCMPLPRAAAGFQQSAWPDSPSHSDILLRYWLRLLCHSGV